MKKYFRILPIIIVVAVFLVLFLTIGKKKKSLINCFECGYLTLEIDSTISFSENLRPVKVKSSCYFIGLGDKWGYIDQKGELVIPPIFDSAGSFYQGKAKVKIGDKYHYIDKKGKIIY